MGFCGIDISCWGNFINYSFWQSFLSEGIAVFIGVILALWVNEWNDGRKDKEKRLIILDILAEEVAENSNNMYHWRGLSKEDKQEFLLHAMLRDDSWRAFSDGGEIKCIKDGQLLYYLSRTYYSIRALRNYAEYYYNQSTSIEPELNRMMDYTEEMIEVTFNKIIDGLGERNYYLEKEAERTEKEDVEIEEVDS